MAAICYSNSPIASAADDIDPARWPDLAGLPVRPDLRVVAGGRVRRAAHPMAVVYRRRRLAALVIAVVLLAAPVVAAWMVAGGPRGGPQPAPGAVSAPALAPTGRAYVVQPGDTLWTIARRLKPDGDIRAMVDRLVARNGSAVLRPGQTVRLD